MICKKCGEKITKPYHTTPAYIGVKVVVLNNEGKILIVRRSETDYSRPFAWETPGGALDDKEDPAEGAAREVKEETGVDIKDAVPFHTLTTFEQDGDKVVMIFYKAFAQNPTVALSYEHDQYKWVTLDEFENMVEGPPHLQKEVVLLKDKIRGLILNSPDQSKHK